jgi:hypothetical protein
MRSKNWPSMPKKTHKFFYNCKNSPSKKIVGIHKKRISLYRNGGEEGGGGGGGGGWGVGFFYLV